MKRMIKFSEGGDPTLSGPKSDLGGGSEEVRPWRVVRPGGSAMCPGMS